MAPIHQQYRKKIFFVFRVNVFDFHIVGIVKQFKDGVFKVIQFHVFPPVETFVYVGSIIIFL